VWYRSSEAIKFEQSLTFNFMRLLLLPMQEKLGAARFEQVKAIGNMIIAFVADTRTSYYRAIAAQQAADLLQRAVAGAKAAAEVAEQQRQAGALGAREVSRHQAYLAETQTQLARSRQIAIAEREKLMRQLGLSKTVQLVLPDLPTKQTDYPNIGSLALSQRLDIESAKQELDIAGQSAGVTNITRFINIQEIGIARERETGALDKRGPELCLELPIFDWGSARMARHGTMIREVQDRLTNPMPPCRDSRVTRPKRRTRQNR
jgi:outer membrane protein TolC